MLSCLCFWNKLHMKRKYLIGRLRFFNRNCLYKSNHSMDFITNLWLQSSNNLKLPLYFSHCNVPVLSAPFCILILKYRIILFFKLRLWMNYMYLLEFFVGLLVPMLHQTKVHFKPLSTHSLFRCSWWCCDIGLVFMWLFRMKLFHVI